MCSQNIIFLPNTLSQDQKDRPRYRYIANFALPFRASKFIPLFMSKMFTPLLLLCLWSTANSQSTMARITFPIDEQQTLTDIARTGLDLHHGHHDHRDAFTTEVETYQLQRFDELGIRYTIDIPDMNIYRKEQAAALRDNPLLCQEHAYNPNVPRNFEYGSAGGFFTYPEILDHLDAMSILYPHLISIRRPVSAIKTYNNNEIFWVRISDQPETDENEPEMLYTGLHHAREMITVSQTIYYMWFLLENYDKDPLIRQIVDNTELYFIPVVNPDGLEYNIDGYDPENDMFTRNLRKNMRDNNENGTFEPDFDGVDLNRNYGYQWAYDDIGSSPWPGNDTYRGPAPFSEPETQAVSQFVQQHDFKLALNYHSYGNALIHPWGYTESQNVDSTLFSRYAELLTQLNRYIYGRGIETVGYNTNGDSDDWMYGDQGVYSMTPEVGTSDDGFYPLKESIIPLCQSTLKLNILAAQLVNSLIDITDENPRYIQPGQNPLKLEFTRYGLVEGPVTVSFGAVSGEIIDLPEPFEFQLDQFQPVERDLAFTVAQDIPVGREVQIEIICQQGPYVFRDTLTKVRAEASVIVSDPGTMAIWETSPEGSWGTTPESYKSGPVSVTDSPEGEYAPNLNSACMLNNQVDLTEATEAYAQFWAKWDIEDYYDYVVFQASHNSTNWENLCGTKSSPGSIFQAYEEPLYDNRQVHWTLEKIDLSAYLGDVIFLRFLLVTDGFAHRDGFYFDDFKVVTVQDGVTSTTPISEFNIKVYPNPASDRVRIQVPDMIKPEVFIFNSIGQPIQSGSVQSGQFYEVNTQQWAPGLYHFALREEGRVAHTGSFQIIR